MENRQPTCILILSVLFFPRLEDFDLDEEEDEETLIERRRKERQALLQVSR